MNGDIRPIYYSNSSTTYMYSTTTTVATGPVGSVVVVESVEPDDVIQLKALAKESSQCNVKINSAGQDMG